MISKEEVKHIARLARLELTEKETEKIQKDLSGILDYFKLLKKAPKLAKIERVGGLKEDLKNTRIDEVSHRKRDLVEKLIKALPNKKDDYIKVKTIRHESFRTNN